MAQFFSWLLIFHLGTILSITCTSLMKHLTFFIISLHKIFPLKFLSLKVRRLFGRMVKLFHELQCVLKCLCNCNCIIFVGTLLLVKEKEKKKMKHFCFSIQKMWTARPVQYWKELSKEGNQGVWKIQKSFDLKSSVEVCWWANHQRLFKFLPLA